MQIPLVTFFVIAAIAYMFFREIWIRTILIESLAAIIDLMVELKNSIGQTLLRLERNEVKNLMGQTIGTTRDHQLVNLQGQVLAEVRDGKVYRGGGAHLLEVRGGEILNASGQPIASVDGGDDAQRALLGAAFLVFCSSMGHFSPDFPALFHPVV